MASRFRLADPHEVGRIDGANPFDPDEIEWDADPHTARKGTVLKTIDYKNYQIVLVQGAGLWAVKAVGDVPFPLPMQGRFTTLKDAMKAIDIAEGETIQ